MKSPRYILVDSSTKGSATSKWGRSVACWAFFYRLDKPPDKVGLFYAPYEGPNRMFIWGVLAGLEYCLNLEEVRYEVIVKGDCQCAINVLNGTWTASDLSLFKDLATRLEQRLRAEKRVDVRYEYLTRTESVYQSIDQCAKEAANFVEQRFGIK